MRYSLSMLVCLGLAACGSSRSGYDDGFQSYNDYLHSREAQLAGGVISGPAVVAEPLSASTAYAAPAAAPMATASVGISDEQNFDAVAARETIESDRARIEARRQQYEMVAPTALPQRTQGTGPNIVDYALRTTNRVGEPVYNRINPMRDSLSVRACAKFPTADAAQEAFLRAGGPERDPKSLDPDGDGFACYWDPAPFRLAVQR